MTINVTPVNDTPTAQDDFFEILAGQPHVSLESILANDSDIENSALVAILVDGPENGTVTLLPDGQFEFAPDPGFSGVDSFTYVANDGELSSLATVQIVVGAVPAPTPPTNEPTDDPTIIDVEDLIDSRNVIAPDSVADETDEENEMSSEDDEMTDVSVEGILAGAPERSARAAVPETEEFEANEELSGLVSFMTDQDRAKAVLSSILLNVSESDLVENRVAEEIQRYEARASFAAVYDAQFLFDQLDEIDRGDSVFGELKVALGTITAFGTIGYVLWALRGGALVALALSQLPAWQTIDPLPILDGYKRDKNGSTSGDVEGFFTN